MVTTDEHELRSRMWSYKDHVKSWTRSTCETIRQATAGSNEARDEFSNDRAASRTRGIQLAADGEWTRDVIRPPAVHRGAAQTSLALCGVPEPRDGMVHAYIGSSFCSSGGLRSGWSRDASSPN